MVEDIPVPVRILLSGHQVITLNTQHHGQPFGQERCIQLNGTHWQFVGENRIAGILITAHEKQFCSYIIKDVEIARSAHELTRCP